MLAVGEGKMKRGHRGRERRGGEKEEEEGKKRRREKKRGGEKRESEEEETGEGGGGKGEEEELLKLVVCMFIPMPAQYTTITTDTHINSQRMRLPLQQLSGLMLEHCLVCPKMLGRSKEERERIEDTSTPV